MHQNSFLIIVAHDKNGVPDTPISFISKPGQGINISKNTWHGVLCPLYSPGYLLQLIELEKVQT